MPVRARWVLGQRVRGEGGMSNATSRSTIAKRAAREAGKSKYEGKPCKHCYSPIRYTSCGACCNCACIKADLQRAREYA
jgi:hypothetical protein